MLAEVLIVTSVGVVAALAGAMLLHALLRRQALRVRVAERRASAAERMAEIGALTSGLAHEIKNPLSTIGLNAQLLAEGIDESVPDAEARQRLGNRVRALRRETDRLRDILTDFLEFASRAKLDLRPTDLNVVVDELLDFFLPEAERHGVRLRADLSRTPVVAPADVKLVKQAVLNLMLNAVQAMNPPEPLRADRFDARRAPEAPTTHQPGARGELILRTELGDDHGQRVARVHVIDTGPGIADDARAKIFKPYFSTKSGGSGLGLPTARRVIEAHGGRIDLYSELSKGTDFTIVLPLVTPEAVLQHQAQDQAQDAPAPRGGPR